MARGLPQMAAAPGIVDAETRQVRREHRRQYRKALWDTIRTLIVAAAIAVLAATLFLPVLRVSGASMEPTLEDGNILVLWSRGAYEPGDLVGFYYQNKLLLKRIIGGPGDIVDMDPEGNVTVNGQLLDEPYVIHKALGETDRTYPYQVPEHHYFVMGDNRTTSIDSRNTAIGCIERDQIVGKVFLRIWPLNARSILR